MKLWKDPNSTPGEEVMGGSLLFFVFMLIMFFGYQNLLRRLAYDFISKARVYIIELEKIESTHEIEGLRSLAPGKK